MENQEISRNKMHEIAMQIMYEFLMMQITKNEINFKQSLEGFLNVSYDEIDIYLKELLLESLKNENEIINYCQSYLKKWKFSRLNTCIQSILIISIADYKYIKENPKSVIINIAIELAKKYGSENDYKFVNGVLDNCLND